MKAEHQCFTRVSQALQHAVATGTLALMAPGLSPEKVAMVMLWYGNEAEVREAAKVVAEFLATSMPAGTDKQLMVDAVLFHSGHRPMMQAMPAIAANVLATNDATPMEIVWAVGERLAADVGNPTWLQASVKMKAAGWLKQ